MMFIFQVQWNTKDLQIWKMENNDYRDSSWYSRKWRREIINDFCRKEFKIEIKPSMGDDFPSVLRQMKRNGADTLFVGAFKARACTLEHVRKMFDPFVWRHMYRVAGCSPFLV